MKREWEEEEEKRKQELDKSTIFIMRIFLIFILNRKGGKS